MIQIMNNCLFFITIFVFNYTITKKKRVIKVVTWHRGKHWLSLLWWRDGGGVSGEASGW
jgi:hypothetical protein